MQYMLELVATLLGKFSQQPFSVICTELCHRERSRFLAHPTPHNCRTPPQNHLVQLNSCKIYIKLLTSLLVARLKSKNTSTGPQVIKKKLSDF